MRRKGGVKVTYNWLKDFVDIKILAEALADKLTMAGLEVTSLEQKHADCIFDIEVTSNRSDCLSVMGIAREVSAITGKKLQVTSYKLQVTKKNSLPFRIKIENKNDCPLYTAKIIKDVKVGPSPDWLKRRLELVGCRSVNNVVDITNYVLFEYGEPLHAFDLDRLSAETIVVRRAKIGEKITTIDGEQKTLDTDILVIADKEKPIAVAGVMGGEDTEVTQDTKNILLEAAVFNPILVRRNRQKLGVQSESSYRFERGIDLEIVEKASCRAIKLIQELAGGRCILAKRSGLTRSQQVRVNLDIITVDKTLGISIGGPKIKNILNKLGFKVKLKAKNNFIVGVPCYRQDVRQEIDLIEEIARVFGYENIPQTLPRFTPQINTSDTKTLVSLIKNILVSLGLNEVITYSLISLDLLKTYNQHSLEILNPLSKEQEILRPTIIPSLAGCVAYNLNQKQDYINIFEIAKLFSRLNNKFQEELVLGIALCGTRAQFILEQGLIKEGVGLLHLKGILEVLFERLGIKDYNLNLSADELGAAIYVAGQKVGIISNLEKGLLGYLDIKNKDVFVAELSLDKIFSYVNLKKKFVSLPVYPGIARDISFILKEDIKVGALLEAIRQKAQELLREVKIADYYKGKQIPPGFKGLTISCLYRSDERTLTETEVNPIHSLVMSMLTERFGAKIR